MLTETGFLALLKRKTAGRGTPAEDFDDLINSTRFWDISRWTQEKEDWADLFEEGGDPMPGLALFYRLKELTATFIGDRHHVDSYVYDRGTKVAILNINRGAHESFLGALYALYAGLSWQESINNRHDYASCYIKEGLGFSLSSAATRPTKGKDVELTHHEATVFGSLFTEL